ncbi:MAG: MBL fold metallo-hydrolase [Deltaproteobacteria bacterium]|nr:MAG: MBL fold metallo-hydrolase [Deltaproteobacteria bacterium]
MRVRIHRGAAEIGGSCVEVEAASGARILLDLGAPFGVDAAEAPLPPVRGLTTGEDPDLLGIIVSHPHQDHWGLVPRAHPSVPVFIGRDAARILRAAVFFGPGIDLAPTAHLEHRRPLRLGPFTVTPYLNDHSAYDAYSLLVEADGKRLFYTGDIRGHGRKRALFDALLAAPPRDIDVLLMEGTNIPAEAPPEPAPAPAAASEAALEEELVTTFEEADGLVLVAFSAQNIDRLVTVYRAAVRAGRGLVVDLYAASIAEATGRASIPKPGFPKLHVLVPRHQRRRVREAAAFERVARIRPSRLFPEALAPRRRSLVCLFRASLIEDLEDAACLDEGLLVWSHWHGYLDEDERVRAFADRHGLPIVLRHTSGHASPPDLKRLADALAPGRIVPIHTFGGDRFASLFERVERQPDGVWWAA